MTFISAQPYDPYFAWQVEVQCCNFRKHGISDKMHVLVWYPDNKLREERGELIEPVDLNPWINTAKKYPEVKFFFYKDKGITTQQFLLYIPQLRPQILARHFQDHPELTQECIFYHDSDIIFNFLPDFESLCADEINWQSDTSGYLDYNYLRRKEDQGKIPENEAVSKLCQVGNVSLETFKSYTSKTGGAQYILKGIDHTFWQDVETQCLKIRRAFAHKDEHNIKKDPNNVLLQQNSINSLYFPNESAGFQSWCADMWAVNMALWSRNKITDVTPKLDFSWATDNTETYLKKPIYHNAGSTGTQPGVFHKSKWIKESPIGKTLSVKKSSASYHYVLAIVEASRIT